MLGRTSAGLSTAAICPIDMARMHSLRSLLPILLCTMVGLMVLTSMVNGLSRRQQEMTDQAAADVQRYAAHLARLTERLQDVDPQFVVEDLTLLGTDPRLATAAVVDGAGIVVTSTNFALREQPALAALPDLTEALMESARSRREVTLETHDKGTRLTAVMGIQDRIRAPGAGRGAGVRLYFVRSERRARVAVRATARRARPRPVHRHRGDLGGNFVAQAKRHLAALQLAGGGARVVRRHFSSSVAGRWPGGDRLGH